MLLWIGLLFFFQNADPPYKASGEFEVKIDLQIKPRPYALENSNPKIDLTETVGERAKRKQARYPTSH